MTLQEIKDQTDIVELVSNYTELIKSGNKFKARVNPTREERTSSFFVYPDTQKYNDFGGDGGDVIDFIEKVENLNRSEALSFLSERLGGSTTVTRPVPRPRAKPIKKNNALLFAQLEQKANAYLQAPVPKGTLNPNRLTSEKYSIVEVDGENTVRIAPIFEKLFEGYLLPTDEKYAEYLFSRVIGYDSYFQCPVIVIRDESERVVDIVRYRPHRESYTDLPKYLYTKSEEKPDSNYLFPLQRQMQLIMRDQGYCYVGEGLKNAINASMIGVPFISIEGAGNIKPGLIAFLKSNRMKDIVMIGAFDGDTAGENAYKRVNAEIPMTNEFDFDSDMDFSEFLKELRR